MQRDFIARVKAWSVVKSFLWNRRYSNLLKNGDEKAEREFITFCSLWVNSIIQSIEAGDYTESQLIRFLDRGFKVWGNLPRRVNIQIAKNKKTGKFTMTYREKPIKYNKEKFTSYFVDLDGMGVTNIHEMLSIGLAGSTLWQNYGFNTCIEKVDELSRISEFEVYSVGKITLVGSKGVISLIRAMMKTKSAFYNPTGWLEVISGGTYDA